MVALLHCRCRFDYNLPTFHCWQMASYFLYAGSFCIWWTFWWFGRFRPSKEIAAPIFWLSRETEAWLCKLYYLDLHFLYENMQLLMSCICLFVSYSAFIHLQPLVHWLILNFFIKIRMTISLRLPGKFTSANGSKCSFLVANSQSFFCLIFLGSLDVIYYLVAVLFPYCLTQTRLACNFSECDLRNSKQLLVLWKMFYISTKERKTCGGMFWIKLDFSGYSRWNLRSPFFFQYFLVR
jgi:hypothetical protein